MSRAAPSRKGVRPGPDAGDPELLPALIVATYGRHHMALLADGRVLEARRRGKKSDVAVGDRVLCRRADDAAVAIESVAPRRNLLMRSDAWRVKELAANVDLVAVVMASRPSFNPWFVWKAVIAARTAGAEALVVRNKCDIALADDPAQAFATAMAALGEKVISVSAGADPAGAVAAFAPHAQGRTTLLIGQSGMGKSTLLNALHPQARARTREYSVALDLGKQTTTATELYRVDTPAFAGSVIDSPGFQEFGLAHVTAGDVIRAMPDILRHAEGCRFYNCTHVQEPGCKVREAVAAGLIDPARHAFYCSLLEEIRRQAQSYG
ncbi:MAG: ribosome small subunit-dependent GTPase A [Duodenibacillus sp.]|nr:ribosome small subunit-dependent GTPase A [Duodenibacillus sp.]